MDESILDTIKKMLGLPEEYEAFDETLIALINAEIAKLLQLGLGPPDGFMITGSDETWKDYLNTEHKEKLLTVKTYMFARIKLTFDPPQSSAYVQILKEMAAEMEWRILAVVDYPWEVK